MQLYGQAPDAIMHSACMAVNFYAHQQQVCGASSELAALGSFKDFNRMK